MFLHINVLTCCLSKAVPAFSQSRVRAALFAMNIHELPVTPEQAP